MGNWKDFFTTWAKAKNAANDFVAHQREHIMYPEDSPDIIMKNDDLSRFFYVQDHGTNGADRFYLVEHAGWMWWGGGRWVVIWQ